MTSKAATVAEYLCALPADRREIIEAVRKVILANLDSGYEEGMQYGMIGYYVPHRIFPDGYHCNPKEPLPFVALGSQKNYVSLYIMGLYFDERLSDGSGETTESRRFQDEWRAAGKKLDMGKCCVRFTKLENVPLQVVGDAIQRMSLKRYLELYRTILAAQASMKTARSLAAKKSKTQLKTASSAAKRKPVRK